MSSRARDDTTGYQSSAAVLIDGLALVTAVYTFVALGIYMYVPELFPTSIRLRGTGFCSMCGRAASIASPFVVVLAYRSAGLTGVLMIVCGLMVMLIGTVLAVGVETMSSSLESISETDPSVTHGAATKSGH
jgi:putative MFS transporter